MGKLLALRWRDVDFVGNVVRVGASYYLGQLTTPKSGKVRAVPLAPAVATALGRLGARQDWTGDDDLGIELKHQPVLSHKLEVMSSHGPLEPEEIETWQIRAEAELTRLRSLTAAQLGAEVMRRGFADLSGEGERTRIGLSNSLCPDAPPVVGGDDINVVEQYNGLLAPVLSALEDAGLLSSEPRGRSALRFYSLTSRGRSALGDDGVETILAARS
jgi:hypothetical protein